MKKNINKHYRQLQKLIPEIKEDPKAWKAFLSTFVGKKPDSTMNEEFKRRLHQEIRQEIELRKEVNEPEQAHWRHWLKLMMGLTGGFAVLSLVALPIVQNEPILLKLTPTHIEKPYGEKEDLFYPLSIEAEYSQNEEGALAPSTFPSRNDDRQQNNALSQNIPVGTLLFETPHKSLIQPIHQNEWNYKNAIWVMNENGYYVPDGIGGGPNEAPDLGFYSNPLNQLGDDEELTNYESELEIFNTRALTHPDVNLIHPDYLQYQDIPIEEWTLGPDGLYRIGELINDNDSAVPVNSSEGQSGQASSQSPSNSVSSNNTSVQGDLWPTEAETYTPEYNNTIGGGMGGGGDEGNSAVEEEAESNSEVELAAPLEVELADPEAEEGEPEVEASPPPPEMSYAQMSSTAVSSAKSFLSAQGVDLNSYTHTVLTSLSTALATGNAVVRFTSTGGSVIDVNVNIYTGGASY